MDTRIKNYADTGDLKSLKYVFVDSLDVDPTFERYEEEYNYCKSTPGLLEPHVELTPFVKDSSKWDENYWTGLKVDLIKNFSEDRMDHMREVAKVFLAEKYQRIRRERMERRKSEEPQKIVRQPKAEILRNTQNQMPRQSREEQEQHIREKKKEIEEHNKRIEAEGQINHIEKKREELVGEKKSDNKVKDTKDSSKKALGIAIAAAIAVIVLVIILVLNIRNPMETEVIIELRRMLVCR
ncbi:hypothetical protein [Schaedlerella arabinosiphila]|uniref:hypothetical protein n=1 Tax=Schaedlerella arabinosiphila TaxID=2044587 RepID=UPI002557D890|nr:hypothetical protein [Schaedlerella arabinosiphila]